MRKSMIQLPPLLAVSLLLAAGAHATPSSPDASATAGVPPSNYGWEYDIQVANRLFENGYVDAAEKDYNKILTAYPDGIPGIDAAWLGLARVHQAKGSSAEARASLQEVLRRDSSAIVAAEARELYRTLKAEVEIEVNEAVRAVQYYDSRYRSMSWWNPFGKLFAYLDVRKSKKQYKKVQENLEAFDPRYLIDPIAKPASLASVDQGTDDASKGTVATLDIPVGTSGSTNGAYRLTAEEMAALIRQAGGTPVTDQASSDALASASTGSNAGTDALSGEGSGESTVVPTSGTGSEAVVPSTGTSTSPLEEVQKTYFSAYQELRQALTSGDTARIQAAQEAYGSAKQSYEAAKLGQINGS